MFYSRLTRDNPLLSRPTLGTGETPFRPCDSLVGCADTHEINFTSRLPKNVAGFVENGLADNTRRAYAADLKHFEAWGSSIPATNIVALYLRLSGYFVTGLILHSERKGETKGEIDWLAIRHPYHAQKARGVAMPDFLGPEHGLTDVILCEVKSSNRGFNKSLRNPESVEDALHWVGILTDDQIATVVPRFLPLLEDDAGYDAVREGVIEAAVRVRPLLCWPSRSVNDTKRWCLTGDEIMRFLDECLDPVKAPLTCRRKYGYELWGQSFEDVVRWVKQRRKEKPPTVEELLDYLRS